MNLETQVRGLKRGTLVKLRTGETAEFIKANRTRFVAKMKNSEYTIPFEMFSGVVDETISQSSLIDIVDEKVRECQTLEPGELFYCIENNRVLVFRFERFAQTRIHGTNPVTGKSFTIPTSLYGGKISALMEENMTQSIKIAKYSEIPEEIHKKFTSLAGNLSPENLTCDGELSNSQVQARLSNIRKQWRDLERQIGIKVEEEDVWKREELRRGCR